MGPRAGTRVIPGDAIQLTRGRNGSRYVEATDAAVQTNHGDRDYCCYWQAKLALYIISLFVQITVTSCNWANYVRLRGEMNNGVSSAYFVTCVIGVVCSIYEFVNVVIQIVLMCDHHVAICNTKITIFHDFLKVYLLMDQITDWFYLAEILVQDVLILSLYIYAGTVPHCVFYTQFGEAVIFVVAVCSMMRILLLALRHCCCTLDDMNFDASEGLCGGSKSENGLICTYYSVVPVFYKFQVIFYIIASIIVIGLFFTVINYITFHVNCMDNLQTTTLSLNSTDTKVLLNITSSSTTPAFIIEP